MALFPLVADGQMYYGYCINCLLSYDGRSLEPWATVIHYISSDAFIER
jgi:hypothetical protein